MEPKKEINYTEIKPWDDSVKADHAAKCGGDRNLVVIPIVTDDDYRFVYLVKRPTRTILQAISEIEAKPESKKDPRDHTSIQNLMLGCVLEGDKSAYENDASIYTALLKEISQLIKTSRVDLKKS